MSTTTERSYGRAADGLRPTRIDPGFVSTVVFDPSRGADVPKARFAYLFPNRQSALIQVRLRPGLSDAERRRAIRLIEQATRTVCQKDGRRAPCFALGVVLPLPQVGRQRLEHAEALLFQAGKQTGDEQVNDAASCRDAIVKPSASTP